MFGLKVFKMTNPTPLPLEINHGAGGGHYHAQRLTDTPHLSNAASFKCCLLTYKNQFTPYPFYFRPCTSLGLWLTSRLCWRLRSSRLTDPCQALKPSCGPPAQPPRTCLATQSGSLRSGETFTTVLQAVSRMEITGSTASYHNPFQIFWRAPGKIRGGVEKNLAVLCCFSCLGNLHLAAFGHL